MTDDLTKMDPEAKAEQAGGDAAAKWGPTLGEALWCLENNFPTVTSWTIQGVQNGGYSAVLMDGPAQKRLEAVSLNDPVWALCLAIQQAADAGLYQDVPPPPPPPPEAM